MFIWRVVHSNETRQVVTLFRFDRKLEAVKTLGVRGPRSGDGPKADPRGERVCFSVVGSGIGCFFLWIVLFCVICFFHF